MPFMRGAMPLRRTLFHLQQGKIELRDDVAVLMIGYNKEPNKEQIGASDFIFWHWAQLQYKNPDLQLIKQEECKTPFALAFLRNLNSSFILFRKWSRNTIQKTLGKTKLVKRREFLERMKDHNPAEFGENCSRQCLCEIQGQMYVKSRDLLIFYRACTSLLPAPDYMKGRWRWNHNLQ